MIGLPLLALTAVGAWVALREADEAERERETTETRRDEQRAAATRARLLEDQALQTARVQPAPRAALVGALETAILADARGRTRRGDLEQAVERVECDPFPRTAPRRAAERDPSVESGRYHCLAVTRDIVGTHRGLLGYPFFARIHYGDGRLAWCKINPIPGEQAVPDPRQVATLPAGCT